MKLGLFRQWLLLGSVREAIYQRIEQSVLNSCPCIPLNIMGYISVPQKVTETVERRWTLIGQGP